MIPVFPRGHPDMYWGPYKHPTGYGVTTRPPVGQTNRAASWAPGSTKGGQGSHALGSTGPWGPTEAQEETKRVRRGASPPPHLQNRILACQDSLHRSIPLLD